MTKNDKLRVAFIHSPNIFNTPTHYDTTFYHFFFDALQACDQLEVTHYPFESHFDFNELLGTGIDVALTNTVRPEKVDEVFRNRLRVRIPLVVRVGDPHDARLNGHEQFEGVQGFGFFPPSYTYKFYPRSLAYAVLVHGIDERQYAHVRPFKERKADKILNSGTIADSKLYGRLLDRLRRPRKHLMHFYKLRTMCNNLDCVEYVRRGSMGFSPLGDGYSEMLQMYRAAIAATTTYPSIKYWEIPAAGCLCFMEVTKRNHAGEVGFKDGKNAIYIDEHTYKDRFHNFMDAPDNEEWAEIAKNGREFVLSRFGNQAAVHRLAELFRELLNGKQQVLWGYS